MIRNFMVTLYKSEPLNAFSSRLLQQDRRTILLFDQILSQDSQVLSHLLPITNLDFAINKQELRSKNHQKLRRYIHHWNRIYN